MTPSRGLTAVLGLQRIPRVSGSLRVTRPAAGELGRQLARLGVQAPTPPDPTSDNASTCHGIKVMSQEAA